MGKYKLGILLLAVLGLGMVLTVRDYRQWRVIDTGNLGQGSETEKQFAPAADLDRPVSFLDQVRLKPPTAWTLSQNDYFMSKNGYPALPKVRTEVARFVSPDQEIKLIISGQTVGDRGPEIIELESKGITQYRQYVGLEEGSFTVFTWETDETVTQKAMTIHKQKLWVIEITCPTSSWKTWAKTFETVYQSVVWL